MAFAPLVRWTCETVERRKTGAVYRFKSDERKLIRETPL
jgi:hypothetical protein